SHTCFFTLDLPPYSTEEIMYERLNYAITHCSSIDGDYGLNEPTMQPDLDEEEDISSTRNTDSGESTLQDQHPLSALIIVDVQNDFIHGTLAMKDCPAKQDGEAVVPIINHLLKTVPFDVVAYTQDWHPKDHISFYENLHLRQHLISSKSKVNATTANLYDTVRFKTPIGEQVLWPTHCIQNTSGAQLHEALIVAHNSVFILKGDNSNIDSYSAFWSNQRKSRTNLDKKLKERNIRNVYIAGLALDFCVASTASHSLELNYRTFIIEDACRGVDESVMKIKVEELKKDGCEFVQADMVESLVRGFMPND
ncbi:unnamed protein product, partial [Didymodactylos carnosus]